MSRVTEQIRLTHADVKLRGYGGIEQWYKHLILNCTDTEPSPKLAPWQNLCLAILNDAIETLKRGPRSEQNKRNWAYPATERWLYGSTADYGVFGFISICEAMNWNPGYVRKGIVALVKKARTDTRHVKRNRLSVRGQYARPSININKKA